MVKGKGPATGFTNPSYCTETSTLPALLLIIRAHIHLYNIQPHEEPGAIKAYWDNQGLIKDVTKLQGFQTWYPRNKAHIDLLIEINNTLHDIQHHCHIKVPHVKRHQDWNKKIHQLERPAQLNVTCDHFGHWSTNRQRPRPIQIPPSPNMQRIPGSPGPIHQRTWKQSPTKSMASNQHVRILPPWLQLDQNRKS